jgi:hypothetical protein
MTDLTTTELCFAAGKALQAYYEELQQLRKEATSPKQIAYIQYQIDAMPGAQFLLGAAAGRDSLRRKLGMDGLAQFDKEQQ